MAVVCYRCPSSGEEVATAIETSNHILLRMRTMDLTIWVWCPHCMVGHQVKTADVMLEDVMREDENEPSTSPSLAGG